MKNILTNGIVFICFMLLTQCKKAVTDDESEQFPTPLVTGTIDF